MKRLFPLLFLLLAGTVAVFAQGINTVKFNLNYPTREVIAPVRVKSGHALPVQAKQFPTREGFRFGGWYTSPECLPEEEWHFGDNGGYNVPATDSMRVEKSMTLYAKWVQPTPIRTVDDLDAIPLDLYGWYVLENDLDLSGVANWIPIGEYEASYEYAPSEWWKRAFKGVFDGQGHTIRGLRISRLITDKTGLFGAVSNGEILNLKLEDSQLIFTAERPYVAPLVGIIEQDTGVAAIRNCHVTGTVIQAHTTNTQSCFHSFTGLCGGVWGGTLENNFVSGKIEVDVEGNGGGELYMGALAGEAYNDTRNCTTLFDFTVRFHSPQPADGFRAYIGGLQASATNVENCTAHGKITVTGGAGGGQLFVGGLVGSERYGTVDGSSSLVQIQINQAGFAQVGGIVGEFSSRYGVMGPAFGINTTRVSHCSYIGKPVFNQVGNPVWGVTAGAGTPPDLKSPWGGSMAYSLTDCSYREKWTPTPDALDIQFTQAPREARPYLWWHWMNGNTSKEGIRKDLEWMQRAGIAGFHQFDAGGAMLGSVPSLVEPTTPYLSDAWKENFAYAIKTADEMGMEVGIASAPGWSSTGGPWVKPEDGMKKLTWSTMEVVGKGEIETLPLPPPDSTIGKFLNTPGGLYQSVYDTITPWYKDIAVLAVPVRPEDKNLQELGATVFSSGGSFTVEQLSDGNIANGAELPLNPNGTHAWIQYSFPEPVTICAYTLAGGEVQDQFTSQRTYNNYLMCSQDGNEWQEVCRIPSSPLPRLTADINPITAKYFRLMVVNPKPDYTLAYYGVPVTQPTGTFIHEWQLHTIYKVNHAEEQAGFAPVADLAEFQTPRSNFTVLQTLDITQFVQPDGTLIWKIPEGKWRVYRFGASLTGKQNHPAPPEATGLEVDKLNPQAWERYFRHYLDLYKDASGGLLGQRGIQYLMTDSYEAGAMTWTDKLDFAFLKANGYLLIPMLPALAGEIIGSADLTHYFLFDWRKTLGDLFAANYDHLNDILAEYDMKGRYTESHENGRAYVGDGMDLKRKATVPMAAIWTDPSQSVSYQVDIRESASVAHIYGQNIVAGESFTTNGALGGAYSWYPGNLKEVADIALLSGLNRFFIHESAHQPSDQARPGLGLLIFGQWFNRHETWAEYARYWTDYLARSCYLLQAGKAVSDILWFYGEDINVAAAYSKALPDVPDGYSYDFASPDVLLNQLTVKDGCAVTPSGMSYKVIVLGEEHTRLMSVQVLRKLKELVEGGVHLVGKWPTHPASHKDMPAEFQQLKKDIWQSGRDNVSTSSLADALTHFNMAPDFQSSFPGVRFVHRVDGNRHIYWVRNFSGHSIDTDIVLRDAAGPLSVLNPVNGQYAYGVLKDGKLHMEKDQALFIVADPSARPLTQTVPLLPTSDVALDGAWEVSFEGLEAPAGTLEWQQLASYTSSKDPAVKYFSGTATYKNSFTLSSVPFGITLDLGEVGQMADVYVNGEHVDFLWQAPYRTAFYGTLKPGKNTVEVKVINTWVNRLIGDAQPGAKKSTFTVFPFYQADSPLQPAGLMGPVQITLLQ